MSAPNTFDTNLLDPPHDDFQMFGAPDGELERDRALSVENYQKIVKYHTWGLKYTILGRKTKGKLFALLKKIVFNQQPHLRANDWHSFILCECDAGPGLLELRYNAPQLSRKNPNGAIARTAARPPPVTTALQTGPNPSQQNEPRIVNQSSNPHSHTGLYPQPQQTPVTSNSLQSSPATQQFSAYPSGFQTPNHFGLDSSNGGPNFQSIPGNLSPAEADSALSLIPDLPDIGLPLDLDVAENQGNALPGVIDQRTITEALEREILRVAYRGLERHPLAFPIGSRPLTATSAEDFSNFPAVFPRELRVRLLRNNSGLESRLDPEGALYSYRGRGPISINNSSPVDCAIVAGKLLDAGSTISDRGGDEGWAVSLTPVEHAFIEATTLNWDAFSKEFSVESRNDFWKLLNGGLNHRAADPGRLFRYGESLPLTTLWDICTNSFQQFSFTYDEALAICPCRTNGDIPSTPFVVSSISPKFEESDRHGVTMQDLLNRFFGQFEPRACPACRSPRDIFIKTFGELPLRLVVKPDPRVLLQHHTSNNVSFKFFNQQKGLIESYRWLGGVYCAPAGQAARYTVFWTDDKRGEAVTGQLCMYDGTQNSGIIVGNIPPSSQDERVPSEWWAHRAPPLLFYERVINPPRDILTTARDAVDGMIQTVNNKEMILAKHCPWEQTSLLLDDEPPRRQFLNGSPTVSEVSCDSGEESAAEWLPHFETNSPRKPNDAIPPVTHETQQMQLSNGQSSQYRHLQEPRMLEQQGLHPQPQPQAELHNSSTQEAPIGLSIQGLETDGEHHSSSILQGQQLAGFDQKSSSDLGFQPFSDSHLQKIQQQHVPLTNEGVDQLFQEMNGEVHLHMENAGKRQRPPSNNFNEADRSGASPSLKRRRYD